MFAKKYMPATHVTDKVHKCMFSDYPCLMVVGYAVNEEVEADLVDLYFPIDTEEKSMDFSLIDYSQAIAVFNTGCASCVAAAVEVTDYVFTDVLKGDNNE